MSEQLDYIGADELVFTNDAKEGIHSGGFSVKSILMKSGMSPIVTVNDQTGGGGQVSDLFANLVVPNWVLSYNNRLTQGGGGSRRSWMSDHEEDEEGENGDDVVDDDLHDKLLELVKAPLPSPEGGAKRVKRTRRRSPPKKKGTRKHR